MPRFPFIRPLGRGLPASAQPHSNSFFLRNLSHITTTHASGDILVYTISIIDHLGALPHSTSNPHATIDHIRIPLIARLHLDEEPEFVIIRVDVVCRRWVRETL